MHNVFIILYCGGKGKGLSGDWQDLLFAQMAQQLPKRRRRRRQRSAVVPMSDSAGQWLRSPTQRLGAEYETKAIAFLETQGLRLLARNLVCRCGEIDAVMLDQTVLVFVEVRYRQHNDFGGGVQSITSAKQRRFAKAAAFFLPKIVAHYCGGRMPHCRFDVLVWSDQMPIWLPNAFESP